MADVARGTHLIDSVGRRDLSAVSLPVLAARPAAWSAFAFLEFLVGAPDATRPGDLLLGVFDPADELVSGQRRDVHPGFERRGAGDEGSTQIEGKLVHHPAWNASAPASPTLIAQG